MPVGALFTVDVTPKLKKVPKKNPKVRSCTIAEIKWIPDKTFIDPRVEDDAQIAVQVFHKFADEPAQTRTVPLSKSTWSDTLTLKSTVALPELRTCPLLFAVRNTQNVDPM